MFVGVGAGFAARGKLLFWERLSTLGGFPLGTKTVLEYIVTVVTGRVYSTVMLEQK